MHRLLVIILLSMYSLGFILFPAGPVSLAETYSQCQTEDPDMDLTDFVFEHLLNMPEIGCFDSPHDAEENEKPHQPLQHIASVTQVVVAITSPLRIQCAKEYFRGPTRQTYQVFNDTSLPTQYLSQVFHPPLV